MKFDYRGLTLESGQVLDYQNPEAIVVCERDMRTLSLQRRYTAHLDVTVLQHLMIGRVVARNIYPGDRRLHAAWLLHDGHECYFPDIPKPLKNLIPEFFEVEKRFERWFHEAFFSIDLLEDTEIQAKIKEIDSMCVPLEAQIRSSFMLEHYEFHHPVRLDSELSEALIKGNMFESVLCSSRLDLFEEYKYQLMNALLTRPFIDGIAHYHHSLGQRVPNP